jgi:Alkylmercury lyase
VAEISEGLVQRVRLYVFGQSAASGRVPQAPQISNALGVEIEVVRAALKQLALRKVLILAPNDSSIWAANPFCAVPSGFRVRAAEKAYWAICIWDALGIAAALHIDALIDAPCGDCSDPMQLEIAGDKLVRGEGIVHFAVPAHLWWENIAFA